MVNLQFLHFFLSWHQGLRLLHGVLMAADTPLVSICGHHTTALYAAWISNGLYSVAICSRLVKLFMLFKVQPDLLSTGNPQIIRFKSARSPVEHGLFLKDIARIPLFNMVFIRKTHFLPPEIQIKDPFFPNCYT